MLIDRLLPRIASRTATIAILGLGYVGLPLAVLFIKAGFRVIGYDTNGRYVSTLSEGYSTVLDVPSLELRDALETGRFCLTSDFEQMDQADIYLICVPTPLSKTRQPDLSYINSALETLRKVWAPGKLVVLESTTYPGTTDELLLPALSQGGLLLDRDFLLAFAPERVDPGNRDHPLASIPEIVGGVSESSTRAATDLYSTVFERVHPVSSAKAAEITKLLENTFRNVNIALVNEFSQICDVLGLDVWEVIEAAKTKPFGFMAFYPGPGIGGHCIPLDPQYLVYQARLSGYEPRLVALADQINQEMPRQVLNKAMAMLNRQAKSLNGSRVLVLGLAYKADVPDTRESPAIAILSGLVELGASVRASDPFVSSLKLPSGEIESLPLTRKEVEAADLIILVTAHRSFDYGLLTGFEEKILDTRNALRRNEMKLAERLKICL